MDHPLAPSSSDYIATERIMRIRSSSGILLKRGREEVHITGEPGAELIERLYLMLDKKPQTLNDLLCCLPKPERPGAESLIRYLVAKRFLICGAEPPTPSLNASPEEFFYWHFGLTPLKVSLEWEGVTLGLVADDSVFTSFFDSCLRLGLSSSNIIYDTTVIERLLSQKQLTFLIAVSSSGSWRHLLQWNEACVKSSTPYLPVLLQDLLGYIGPLVIPTKTACLACAKARFNSNLPDPDLATIIETAIEAEGSNDAFHPALVTTMASIASFELFKYVCKVPRTSIGQMVEVNLLVNSMKPRPVLKAPRCSTCSQADIPRQEVARLADNAYQENIPAR